MQTQVLTILSLAPGSSGTFYPPFVRHTCRYPFSFTYSGYSLEFHSLSLSLSLNRMFVSQRGRSRPVESWWSDSLTVECLASPMMWQINWDLGLLFGFPTKPTHWKRQQNDRRSCNRQRVLRVRHPPPRVIFHIASQPHVSYPSRLTLCVKKERK